MARHPSSALLLTAVSLLICLAGSLTGQDRTPPQQQSAKSAALTLQERLSEHPDWVTATAFSPDGRYLAVAGFDFLYLYNVSDGTRTRLGDPPGAVEALAFSPQGHLLAAGGYQKTLLFEITTSATASGPPRPLTGHRSQVTGTSFSPDGTRLLTSSADRTVRLWDVEERTCLTTLDGFELPVQAVAFSPDGSHFATACGDPDRPSRAGTVDLWSVDATERVHRLTAHERAATGVCFSPDGSLLLSSGFDEVIRIHDVASGMQQAVYEGHSRPTQGCGFVDPSRVASISGGAARGKNELRLWSVVDQADIASIEAHPDPINTLAVSSDGRRLATGAHDKTVAVVSVAPAANPQASDIIRVGIIGLDTSHAGAFARTLNDPKAKPDVAGCRVVCAYPHGSADIESSASRIPKYTQDMRDMGIEIVDSVDELLSRVDAVLLETNDGRLHLEQFVACAKAGKPVFLDKPVAADLADTLAVYEIARRYKTRMFSSSSLRFTAAALEARDGKLGKILGCDAYSPAHAEKTHSDLYWYGIHGVELLYTVMGTGCQHVTRHSTADFDVVSGTWDGGRIGSFRGIRRGKLGYGGTAFGEKAIGPLTGYSGYRPLVVEIVRFFKGGDPPVSAEETLEIYTFMAAAETSRRADGALVKLADVRRQAEQDAAERLKEYGE